MSLQSEMEKIKMEEWDPQTTVTTAWTTLTANNAKKGRRAYGRHNNDTVPVRQPRRTSKKRALEEQQNVGDFELMESLPMKRSSSLSSAEKPDYNKTSSSETSSSFRASFHSSTSSSSLYEAWLDNAENTNPNISLREESPLPPTKLKKVQAEDVNNSSFSFLAKSGEVATSWAPNSNRSLAEGSPLPPCSPALSDGCFSYSRRRGICDSPSPSVSDVKRTHLRSRSISSGNIMNGGSTNNFQIPPKLPGTTTQPSPLPPCSPALSSDGLSTRRKPGGVCDLDDGRRSRSTSRSRSSGSSGSLPRLPPQPIANNTRTSSHSGVSDDEASDSEAEESNRSVNQSFESTDGVPFGNPASSSLLPPKPLRRCSFDDGFDQSVFGTAISNKTSVDSVAQVFESMSSYQDLKFLINALRKEQHSTATFFFNKSWTVAPPVVWETQRRATFLQFLKNLGFSLRSGGGSVAFCQVGDTKGSQILKLLEEALVNYKKNQIQQQKPSVSETPLFASTIPAPAERSTEKMSTEKLSFSSKVFDPFVDQEVEETLLVAVDSLTLSETQNSKDVQQPLVRKVTLDTKPSPEKQDESQHNPNRLSNSVHFFEEEDEGPSRRSSKLSSLENDEEDDDHFDSSFDVVRPSRPSGEHHAGGQDFMHHLNPGWSPPEKEEDRNTSAKKSRSLFGRSRKSKSSARSSFSPMPQQQATNNFALPECVETPLPKRGLEGFGNGRDWGVSAQCDKDIIDQLVTCFEKTCEAAGYAIDSPILEYEQFISSSTGLAPLDMHARSVSTGNLGFDLELDGCDASNEYHAIVPSDEIGLLDGKKQGHSRRFSVGSTIFAGLKLDDGEITSEKTMRKRVLSFAKRKRVSLCASALDPFRRISTARQSMFARLTTHDAIESPGRSSLVLSDQTNFPEWSTKKTMSPVPPVTTVHNDPKTLHNILMFLRESELLQLASLVCNKWSDAATQAHASLMLISVGCDGLLDGAEGELEEPSDNENNPQPRNRSAVSIAESMERSWPDLLRIFPWACFLSGGAFKDVFRVFNTDIQAEEAVSVMNVDAIEASGNKNVIGTELAVSAMLSSLARRNICPNFIITRGVFTCRFKPPATRWGSEMDKYPKGKQYGKVRLGRDPSGPKKNERGRFQYIRMELCEEGDMEEYIKRQHDGRHEEMLELWEGRSLLFQIAFALHVASDRYCMKHYDMKLLNIFLKKVTVNPEQVNGESFTVLQYGLGSHTFNLRMPTSRALIAKVADYGTANVQAESDGRPVTISQFTTFENTPPEYFIMGDAAVQGYGHDRWGLGLCMLHVFTGCAPYEEILEEVTCPPELHTELEKLWGENGQEGFGVIRSAILNDDDNPDVLYHTFYRYLVLFGIPKKKFLSRKHGKVWDTVVSTLLKPATGSRKKSAKRGAASNVGANSKRFVQDQEEYSLSHGSNRYIARARERLENAEGAMDLLLSLVSFDPKSRATPLDVLNSRFMRSLQEDSSPTHENDIIYSFMAYSSSF